MSHQSFSPIVHPTTGYMRYDSEHDSHHFAVPVSYQFHHATLKEVYIKLCTTQYIWKVYMVEVYGDLEIYLKTLFNIVEDRFKKNLNFDVCVV